MSNVPLMKTQNLLLASITFLIFGCTTSDLDDNSMTVDEPTMSENTPADPISGFIPCENGMAGSYPCKGYDLYAFVDLDALEGFEGNDNWGWTDPLNGKEYVLVGLDNGTAFVDISIPDFPKFLGKLPTATDNSIWRDIKVYQNHAYIVSEAPGHGIQVFDMTRLRTVNEPQTFTPDARVTNFGSAHNIAINEDSGFAYVLGSQLYNGGPVFYDLTNPKNPQIAGGYQFSGYTHDAQIVTYTGPDETYAGKEIFMGSHSDGQTYNKLAIIDVTDKDSPKILSEISYSNPGYTHQNWLSEDQRYLFLGDELDEINMGGPTRTLVFDLSELDNPQLHHVYNGVTRAIDHNGYIKDEFYYLANYTGGLRVINVNEIGNERMGEIGFFDTYPSDDKANFAGAWSVYPFFESGIIAINDINSGLFLVKAKNMEN